MSIATGLANFPNLGVDGDQISMIAIAFASQTDLFYQFAGLGSSSNGFLRNIAFTFGLIGFTYIGIMHTAWRAVVVFPWLVLLLIMLSGPSYTGGNVFFIKLSPTNHQGMVAPIDPLKEHTYDEMIKINNTPGGDLAETISKFQTPKDRLMQDHDISNGLYMFGPQAAAIHVSNEVRRGLAQSLFPVGSRTLSDRLASASLMKNVATDDFRSAYHTAAFRTVCTASDPALEGFVQVSPKAIPPHVSKAWQDRNITLGDFIRLHMLFYSTRAEISKLAAGADLNSADFAKFALPPLLDDSKDVEKFTGLTGLSAYSGLEGDGISGALTSAETLWSKFIVDFDRKENDFKAVLLKTLASDYENKEVLNANIAIYMPVVDSSSGSLNTSGNVLNRGLSRLNWGSSPEIDDCKEYHKYLFDVMGNIAEESLGISATSAAFATKLFEECQTSSGAGSSICDGITGGEWSGMTQKQKLQIAYKYAQRSVKEGNRECAANTSITTQAVNAFTGIFGLLGLGEKIVCQSPNEALEAVKHGLIVNLMRNDQVVADGILQNAQSDQLFQGKLRQTLFSGGQKLTGVFLWFQSAVGGFAAGTYSEIMPLIVTWGMALIIVMTPFLYLMGLLIPEWSLMIFIMPVLAVLYLKVVEISFILIKAIFNIFRQGMESGVVVANTNITDFYDILLGMAYTAAFAIALFLMFGLKNPAGLVQQVSKSADQTAQISGREALQLGGTALGVAKGGAALVTGGIGGLAAIAGKNQAASFMKERREAVGGESPDTMESIGNFLGDATGYNRKKDEARESSIKTTKAREEREAVDDKDYRQDLVRQEIAGKKKYAADALERAAEANDIDGYYGKFPVRIDGVGADGKPVTRYSKEKGAISDISSKIADELQKQNPNKYKDRNFAERNAMKEVRVHLESGSLDLKADQGFKEYEPSDPNAVQAAVDKIIKNMKA